MAGNAFLRYPNRTVTSKSGGRYDLAELWMVPNITNTAGTEGTAGRHP